MIYRPESFFNDMLGCFNKVQNSKLNKDEKINGILDAYSILQDMDSKWSIIEVKHKEMATYYWRVCIPPEAAKYCLILDGGEPRRVLKGTIAIGK